MWLADALCVLVMLYTGLWVWERRDIMEWRGPVLDVMQDCVPRTAAEVAKVLGCGVPLATVTLRALAAERVLESWESWELVQDTGARPTAYGARPTVYGPRVPE